MSNQIVNETRRTFLKGAASATALSVGAVGGLSIANQVFASDLDATSGRLTKDALVNNNGITVLQRTHLDRETVMLINNSEKIQMINIKDPISLIQTSDGLVVKVNQIESEASNGMLAFSPHETLSFDVKVMGLDTANTVDIPVMTNVAQNKLKISSENRVFDRVISVEMV